MKKSPVFLTPIFKCRNMEWKYMHRLITVLIASVWLANGLLCKVLNLVPRHQQIVAAILNSEHAQTFTVSIGVAETAMAIWILSEYRSRLNVITQIAVITTMNVLEFFLVPQLLLWGKLNSVWAFLFIIVICCNEFVLRKKLYQRNVLVS